MSNEITPEWRPPVVLVARRPSRQLMLGAVSIGGSAPVSLQSMTNTDTRQVAATVRQIEQLAAVGCQLIRLAVPDREAARALAPIKRQSRLPIIADIHFNPELALAAIDSGVQGLRINPGTIHNKAQLKRIAKASGEAGVVVRIGINGGSLEPELLRQFNQQATPAALATSALRHCEQFEEWGCHKLKVSLKSSSTLHTLEAYRRFAAATNYPLHLGLTEAGLPENGGLKSAVVLGCLLLEGIGDTVRVSLTADPIREIMVGRQILAACGLREEYPEIIACPTCGRTEIDLVKLATEVEAEVRKIQAAGFTVAIRKIAVMGCPVNGPGEARDADIGIAGGRHKGVLFRRGQVIGTFPEEQLKKRLLDEIRASIQAAGDQSENG